MCAPKPATPVVTSYPAHTGPLGATSAGCVVVDTLPGRRRRRSAWGMLLYHNDIHSRMEWTYLDQVPLVAKHVQYISMLCRNPQICPKQRQADTCHFLLPALRHGSSHRFPPDTDSPWPSAPVEASLRENLPRQRILTRALAHVCRSAYRSRRS